MVQVYLRNKFNFSEVHGSMNITGHVQSKGRPWGGRHVNFAWDPLRSYFHAPQKNEIHLIFTLCFYIVFAYYLWNFDLNLANKRQRKKKSYNPTCLVITLSAVTMA